MEGAVTVEGRSCWRAPEEMATFIGAVSFKSSFFSLSVDKKILSLKITGASHNQDVP